jgi:hypothetical protein
MSGLLGGNAARGAPLCPCSALTDVAQRVDLDPDWLGGRRATTPEAAVGTAARRAVRMVASPTKYDRSMNVRSRRDVAIKGA